MHAIPLADLSLPGWWNRFERSRTHFPANHFFPTTLSLFISNFVIKRDHWSSGCATRDARLHDMRSFATAAMPYWSDHQAAGAESMMLPRLYCLVLDFEAASEIFITHIGDHFPAQFCCFTKVILHGSSHASSFINKSQSWHLSITTQGYWTKAVFQCVLLS